MNRFYWLWVQVVSSLATVVEIYPSDDLFTTCGWRNSRSVRYASKFPAGNSPRLIASTASERKYIRCRVGNQSCTEEGNNSAWSGAQGRQVVGMRRFHACQYPLPMLLGHACAWPCDSPGDPLGSVPTRIGGRFFCTDGLDALVMPGIGTSA